ncbi:MAG TPA: GNAT family N-acetyltransferase [Gaiellaceae bacterium]|nr:GNAT family N-acetyltransferase [Gaiellaceae bacterium]
MIDFETTTDGLRAGDLEGFFVDWPICPSPERHLELLRGSEHVVLARDRESGRVVGFVNALGDGVQSAFIPLLEVLPEHQGRGVGTELVRRMLELLEGRYMIDLSCDDELVPFYERFGMHRFVGMGLRNPGAISA